MATLAVKQTTLSWFLNRELLGPALVDSFRRMTPRYQWRNPVMFVVYIGSVLRRSSGSSHRSARVRRLGLHPGDHPVVVATLVFANFAEAPPKAAARLRPRPKRSQGYDRQEDRASRTRRAHRGNARNSFAAAISCWSSKRSGARRRRGRRRCGGDNESAVTGESAPVIRAAGSDFNTVTGGTWCCRTGSSCASGEPRRGVPRSHDQHGRRRVAAEDAQRDRAHHPCSYDDAHLPPRESDAPALFDL